MQSTEKKITAEVFQKKSEVSIGKQVYIVERHFLGKREMTEAISTVITNSLKLEKLADKTA